MATIIQHLLDLIEEHSDPRTKDLPLMGSPIPLLGILVFYNYFVNSLGPRLFASREPLEFKYFMVLYNIFQIIINVYVFYWTISEAYIKSGYSLICAEVDYSNDPSAVSIAMLSWTLLLVKILDLLDTVMMILRKRERQVTFLHVFHHSGMVFALWIATKFMPGGHGVMVPLINCPIHAIMYFYYLLTVLYPEYKKSIWWKKHLTELQMVQFVILSVHAGMGALNSNCNYPKIPIGIFSVQAIIMLFMFWDFYKKSYLSKTKINRSKINNNNNAKYNKPNVKAA